MSEGFEATEAAVIQAVQWLKLLIETVGAATVGIGMLLAVWQFARMIALHEANDYNGIRLTLRQTGRDRRDPYRPELVPLPGDGGGARNSGYRRPRRHVAMMGSGASGPP